MKARATTAAFSLVEVIVALLVLGVAIVGLTQGIAMALRSNKDSEWQTTAAFLAAGQIELLRADGLIIEGVTEGKGSAELSKYEWTETITETPTKGLYEVAIEVRRAADATRLYELRTLLFDPPARPLTNSPSERSRSSRSSRRSAL